MTIHEDVPQQDIQQMLQIFFSFAEFLIIYGLDKEGLGTHKRQTSSSTSSFLTSYICDWIVRRLVIFST
jgi:hypothetical protein